MELLQWAFFDSQEIESWYSSGVKSAAPQAKSRKTELQSETFPQPLAKEARGSHSGWVFEGFPVEQGGCTAPEQHRPSQFSCGIPLSKDLQAEAYQEQEKAIKESQAKVFWDRTAESAQGELGKSLKHVRYTRLVFLKGHSSKEWKVPGWLFCA